MTPINRAYIAVILSIIAVGIICILSGCASTGYHGSYTCPICGAKIFQYKDSRPSTHKQDINETDSKQEPLIKLEIPLNQNKLGG